MKAGATGCFSCLLARQLEKLLYTVFKAAAISWLARCFGLDGVYPAKQCIAIRAQPLSLALLAQTSTSQTEKCKEQEYEHPLDSNDWTQNEADLYFCPKNWAGLLTLWLTAVTLFLHRFSSFCACFHWNWRNGVFGPYGVLR